MILSLPNILHDEKYKNQWEWDGWKPKAKPTAPKELKDAIAEWVKEATADEIDTIEEVQAAESEV